MPLRRPTLSLGDIDLPDLPDREEPLIDLREVIRLHHQGEDVARTIGVGVDELHPRVLEVLVGPDHKALVGPHQPGWAVLFSVSASRDEPHTRLFLPGGSLDPLGVPETRVGTI